MRYVWIGLIMCLGFSCNEETLQKDGQTILTGQQYATQKADEFVLMSELDACVTMKGESQVHLDLYALFYSAYESGVAGFSLASAQSVGESGVIQNFENNANCMPQGSGNYTNFMLSFTPAIQDCWEYGEGQR